MKAFSLKHPSFQERVYEILKKVPKGRVSTYSNVARALNTKAYRAVGNALNKNPRHGTRKSQVPCHRVVKSSGEVGGFATGKENKIKLLKKEGIKIEKEKIDLKKYKFDLN